MFEFKCHKCGKCCKDFESVSIFDFELQRFLQNAQKIGYNPKITIKPENTRSIGDKFLIILYTWEKGEIPCPFLNEKNQCRIYNEKPLFCSLYPFPQEFHAAPWRCYREELMDPQPKPHEITAFFPNEIEKAYAYFEPIYASAALLYSIIKFYLFGRVMFVRSILSSIPITQENSVNLMDFFEWYNENGKKLKRKMEGINTSILANKDYFVEYMEIPQQIDWYRSALPNFDEIFDLELPKYFNQRRGISENLEN